MKSNRVLGWAGVWWLIGCAPTCLALAPPEELYCVQVGSFTSDGLARASALSEQLTMKGWTPIEIVQVQDGTGMPIKVRFGRFATYADADWWKRALQRRDCPDAFVRNEPSNGAEAVACYGPLTPNFFSVPGFRQASTGAIQAARAKHGRHIDQLFSEAPERISADTTTTKEIISALEPIANGLVAATRKEVCQARIAIAHATHYGRLRWLTAYHMYGEALALAEPQSAEEAECLLQRAALLMQLAKSNKGTLKECRRACQIVTERVPKQVERAHAVAALIHAESLFDEGNYDQAMPGFLSIVQKWPNRQREIVAAQVYAGITAAKLGRHSEAKDLLAQVVEMQFDPEQFFGWRGKIQDPALDAIPWLVQCCEITADAEGAKKWRALEKELRAKHGDRLLRTRGND